jgi:hypothetical protein
MFKTPADADTVHRLLSSLNVNAVRVDLLAETYVEHTRQALGAMHDAILEISEPTKKGIV